MVTQIYILNVILFKKKKYEIQIPCNIWNNYSLKYKQKGKIKYIDAAFTHLSRRSSSVGFPSKAEITVKCTVVIF